MPIQFLRKKENLSIFGIDRGNEQSAIINFIETSLSI